MIGQGTFGIVHKAVWRGSVVAAKLINIPAGSESDINQEIEMCRYVHSHDSPMVAALHVMYIDTPENTTS